MRKNLETDVVIIGAGIAGIAAAITLLKNSVRVMIIDQKGFPRHRPGETFHPGVEVIFKELGIREAIGTADFRHSGQFVQWNGEPSYQAFGADENGPWLGFQIARSTLDQIMLNEARKMGAEILLKRIVKEPIFDGDSTVKLRTKFEDVKCSYIVDASGVKSWSTRFLGSKRLETSPKLYAKYGYFEVRNPANWDVPVLKTFSDRWTWIARISNQKVHWMSLIYPGNSLKSVKGPKELLSSKPIDKTYAADVTWSVTQPSVNHRCFAVGDAALRLDPLSSHGNLRALLTGINTGIIISKIIKNPDELGNLSKAYNEWIAKLYKTDARKLIDFYSELRPVPEWISELISRHQNILH